MFTHACTLDPMAIGTNSLCFINLSEATWPLTVNFVAKKSAFQIPFLHLGLKLTGMISIDRENLHSAIQSLNKTAEIVKSEQRSFGIAPEGTRRRSRSIGRDSLQKLKKGPFHLAKACNIDIIPVAII